MDVPVEAVRGALKKELQRRPKVSGPGFEAGKIYISQSLSQALVAAEQEASRLNDEYVSVEHLLLGIMSKCAKEAVGHTLQEVGVTSESFLPVSSCKKSCDIAF